MYKQVQETESHARTNEMKINYKKTKLIVFCPCRTRKFMPELILIGHHIKVVYEIRLLGLKTT